MCIIIIIIIISIAIICEGFFVFFLITEGTSVYFESLLQSVDFTEQLRIGAMSYKT